jgi:hypothetical protein
MITYEKLRIYEKFDGDPDGFSRGGSANERQLFADGDWRLIGELLQALTIVQSGAATSEFEEQVNRQLSNAAPEQIAQDFLRALLAPKKASAPKSR